MEGAEDVDDVEERLMLPSQPQLDIGLRPGSVAYSPRVSNDAFPPAAVVLIVNVRSVTKRNR